MTLTVSAHGTDEAAWAEVEERWRAWWAGVVQTHAPAG